MAAAAAGATASLVAALPDEGLGLLEERHAGLGLVAGAGGFAQHEVTHHHGANVGEERHEDLDALQLGGREHLVISQQR